MLFRSWSDVGRVLAMSLLVYPTLVLVLRVSGKRTLAKMNAFDLVVTVALGSTLATILLSADVSRVEGPGPGPAGRVAAGGGLGVGAGRVVPPHRQGVPGAAPGSCWRSGCGPRG
jgi:hypothetical protein